MMKKNIVRISAQTCEASELRASSENAPDSCGKFGPGPLIMRRGLCPDADNKFGYPSIYLLGFWWHLSVASSLPKILFKRPCVKMRPGPEHPWGLRQSAACGPRLGTSYTLLKFNLRSASVLKLTTAILERCLYASEIFNRLKVNCMCIWLRLNMVKIFISRDCKYDWIDLCNCTGSMTSCAVG